MRERQAITTAGERETASPVSVSCCFHGLPLSHSLLLRSAKRLSCNERIAVAIWRIPVVEEGERKADKHDQILCFVCMGAKITTSHHLPPHSLNNNDGDEMWGVCVCVYVMSIKYLLYINIVRKPSPVARTITVSCHVLLGIICNSLSFWLAAVSH